MNRKNRLDGRGKERGTNVARFCVSNW